MSTIRSIAAVSAAGALLLVLGAADSPGQKVKGKSRPAPTNLLMKGIVQPNCAGIGASLKDAGPADEKAWQLLLQQAACLNEMSYVLMDDGRCPDGVWAGAAKALREGSAGLLDAAQKKELDAARTAFKNVTGACAACHKAHKGK